MMKREENDKRNKDSNMKIIRCIAILIVAVLVCGCVQTDQTLTIKQDGAGSYEVNYMLPEYFITQVKAMFELEKLMAAVSGETNIKIPEDDYVLTFLDPTEERIRQYFLKYQKRGIILESVKIKAWGLLRNVRLKVRFNNLKAVAKTDLFADYGFSLLKQRNGNYILSFEAQDQIDETAESVFSPESGEKSLEFLNGFKFVLRVNVPGMVLQTTAKKRTAYKAMWSYDFDENRNAFSKFRNEKRIIIFDGKNLDLPEIHR
ncbi:hypothetical protein ACFLS1_05240 [Verrucomicrobiota bacterium]